MSGFSCREPNGCRKSSILKAVLEAAGWKEDADLKGQEKEESRDELKKEGKIETAAGLIISYVPQTPSGLEGTLKEYADRYDLPESTFLALLRKMDFQECSLKKTGRLQHGTEKEGSYCKKFM